MATRVETGGGGGYNLFSDPEKQGYLQTALGRGVSQKKIDQFLAENTNDYQRLSGVEADRPVAGLMAAGGGGATTPSGGLPPSPGAPAPGGTSFTPGQNRQADVSLSGGGPVGMGLPGPGSLRQGLGSRFYPSLEAPLAGLRKAY